MHRAERWTTYDSFNTIFLHECLTRVHHVYEILFDVTFWCNYDIIKFQWFCNKVANMFLKLRAKIRASNFYKGYIGTHETELIRRRSTRVLLMPLQKWKSELSWRSQCWKPHYHIKHLGILVRAVQFHYADLWLTLLLEGNTVFNRWIRHVMLLLKFRGSLSSRNLFFPSL